ncbi:imidazolonepropionase [Gudongella sp. DL1XJH-153]|uniref:imidazolonepropionase n=1 Tax=Gudongella sp. DL1XJH-153 TaxID=3409804 RepID=UPI003BB4D880
MAYLLLKDCMELLTMADDSTDLVGIRYGESILIEDERVKKIGKYNKIIKGLHEDDLDIIDCSDYVVMPGYVDSHTHLIFGGSRVDEYVELLTNTPDEVKKRVGRVGLDSSMHATKNAEDDELHKSSALKLERMLKSGTTTVEIKSGYGIDKDTELRMLRIVDGIRKTVPSTIFSTYLGAHYYDVEMGKEKYIDYMIKEVMPTIKEEKLAQFSDVWCDHGYYTAEESYRVLSAGRDYGMVPSIHTECYSSIGGAKVAAELRAANAGHLNYLSEKDTNLLRDAGVVGVLLPGTDFSVKHSRPFNPRPMIDAGLEIAIATNLNPGNWIENMDIALTLACRNHGMSEKEALRAATLGGAKALRVSNDYGSLEEGKFADIQIRKSDSYKNVVYKFGVDEMAYVIKHGSIVYDNK